MDEDFKDVTQNSRVTGIVFIMVILIILVGGYFLVFKQINFSVKNIELELGDKPSTNVEDYLSNYGGPSSNYTLNLTKVDENAVGEYTYSVSNGKMTKKGKITIADTMAPEFTLREMTIEEGNADYFLGDFLESCEDFSKPCLVTLKNEKDDSKFEKAGSYTIDIEVADVYNNKKTAKATLTVVEKGSYVDPRTLDLEYASNSKGTAEFEGKIYKKLDKAINSQTDEARDEMSAISTIDLETYVQENHPGYKLVSSTIVELYNKSHFIIGYAIELKISNGQEMVVYVDANNVPADKPSDETNDEEVPSE